MALTFGGASITLNSATETVTGGTVQGIVGVVPGIGTAFGVHGLSLSAVAVYNAALTGGMEDDRAILRTAFAGADTFVLSNMADRARGYGGNDSMTGNNGNDRLYGDGGNDRLLGGNDADQLYAGTGADVLNGGRGRDVLHGGTDPLADVFVWNSRLDSAVGANCDVVRNFTIGADDINLRAVDAKAGTTATNEAFLWGGTAAKAHGVWWAKIAEGVVLRADVNGDARADFEILLANATSLGSGDVLL